MPLRFVEAMEAAKPVPRRASSADAPPARSPRPHRRSPVRLFNALCDAADALAGHRRAVERISSRYLSFVDSPRAARAASPDARPDAQSDVETHLATLLLVEAELQAALKRLEVSHVRAGTITVTPGDRRA